MNNTRRKALERIQDQLDCLKCELEDLKDEEQEALENIPESLQGSERYEIAEAASYALDNAVSNLEEVLSNIWEAAA